MRRALTSLAIPSICLLCTLMGCSSPPSDPAGDSFEVLRKDESRIVVRAARATAGMDAELEGTLAIGADGCVGILEANGVFQVAIFPFETRWGDEPDTLGVNGETVRIGDRMRLQGGMTSDVAVLDLVHKECSGAGQEVFDSTGTY